MSIVQDIQICLNCGELIEYCDQNNFCDPSEFIIIHRQQG